MSSGSNRCRPPRISRTLAVTCLLSLRNRGLIDEVVDPLLAGQSPERRARDEDLAVVAAAVARLLDLLLHHADDEKRRPAEEHGLSDRVGLSEDVVGELVADEEHPTLERHVVGVQESAARVGVDVAHRAELGRDAGDVHGDRLGAVVELQRLRVFARDRVQTARLRADRVDVVFAQADLAPLPEPLERDRGQARPGDADLVADARRVDRHLPLEPAPEGEQQRDGDRSPDDAEDRQERAQLLAAHVPPHLPQGVLKRRHRNAARLSRRRR